MLLIYKSDKKKHLVTSCERPERSIRNIFYSPYALIISTDCENSPIYISFLSQCMQYYT
uniref:Uncharacterized protein n=1 Tax=Meloidogyne incognita TaxID=6306 RepID=A0A914KNR2_MELIC